jgi:hypothetical protein
MSINELACRPIAPPVIALVVENDRRTFFFPPGGYFLNIQTQLEVIHDHLVAVKLGS